MSNLRSFAYNMIQLFYFYSILWIPVIIKLFDTSEMTIFIFLPKLKYFLSWNSLSREISCSLENAVLLLRAAAAAAAASDVESFLILTPPLAMHWPPPMLVIWLDISSDSSSLLCVVVGCFFLYMSKVKQKIRTHRKHPFIWTDLCGDIKLRY